MKHPAWRKNAGSLRCIKPSFFSPSSPKMAWATKQQNPPLLILFDSCFLQFWLEQNTVMTYVCNTAYLPSLLSQMGNHLPQGTPLQLGSGRLLRNQLPPKSKVFSLTWFPGWDSVSVQRQKPYGHKPQPGAPLALGSTKMTLRAPGQSQGTPGPTPSDGWWVEGTRDAQSGLMVCKTKCYNSMFYTFIEV